MTVTPLFSASGSHTFHKSFTLNKSINSMLSLLEGRFAAVRAHHAFTPGCLPVHLPVMNCKRDGLRHGDVLRRLDHAAGMVDGGSCSAAGRSRWPQRGGVSGGGLPVRGYAWPAGEGGGRRPPGMGAGVSGGGELAEDAGRRRDGRRARPHRRSRWRPAGSGSGDGEVGNRVCLRDFFFFYRKLVWKDEGGAWWFWGLGHYPLGSLG
ncbi:unnamed protein product [Urochloa humidicola]